MRQRFIDWNYTEFLSPAFKKAEAEIDSLYAEGKGKLQSEARGLLKDGE
jgi:V/A-type H+-transporting ATPase subunit A